MNLTGLSETEMKYRFSETEMGIGEDTLSRCTACRQWHKGEQGFDVDVEGTDSWMRYRVKLCEKCADIYIPMLEEAVQRIFLHISGGDV